MRPKNILAQAAACGTGVLILVALVNRPLAHESPVDHVERSVRLSIADGNLMVRYRLQITERAALLQLHRMDLDGDGKISAKERDIFFDAFQTQLAARLTLQIEQRILDLKPAGPVKLDAEFGQTFVFSAPLKELGVGRHAGSLIDGYSRDYPGAYRVRAEGGRNGAPKIEVKRSENNAGLTEHPGTMTIDFEIVQP